MNNYGIKFWIKEQKVANKNIEKEKEITGLIYR